MVAVSVPATSANLGPGYDAVGLALELRDTVSAEIGTNPGVVVEISGQGAGQLPKDASHLIARTILQACFDWGKPLTSLKLQCNNEIPQGRGLGSSAAAIVAALVLARELVQAYSVTDSDLLRKAADIEGHADNVSACLLGGLTLSWSQADGVHSVSLPVHHEVVAVLGTPEVELSTQKARGMLPSSVTHADASFNVGRSALLVAGLTQDPTLLLAGTDDRLHQPFRSAAYPASADLVSALREQGIASSISGAGPSVLALCRPEQVAQAEEFIAAAGFAVRTLAVSPRGAMVL